MIINERRLPFVDIFFSSRDTKESRKKVKRKQLIQQKLWRHKYEHRFVKYLDMLYFCYYMQESIETCVKMKQVEKQNKA